MKHLEFNADQTESIVFLHGGNVAGWMWGEQLPAFADYHLLVPDLPGFGASNDCDWVSVNDTADQIAQLVAERAHAGTAHIVGLSLGSSVAMSLGARHPHLVQSLFLASATVTPPSRSARVLGRVMVRFWERPWFWAFLARGYGLPPEDRELFTTTGLGIRRQTAERIFDEVSRGVPASELAAISAPTCAVAGQRDSPSIATGSLAELTRWVPTLTAAVAPGMHHQWNIENVELFNACLRNWLTGGELYAQLRPFSPGSEHH